MIIGIIAGFFLIRLIFLNISKKHEKAIIANGGKEYGIITTKWLTVVHILFYAACVWEAFYNNVQFDLLSAVGLALLIFSMCMLCVVVRLLGNIWTIKLMLVKNHQFNNHWLFRTVKHPNYFLNIVPELIGVSLLCHAFYSAVFILPVYAYILFRRIREENYLLKEVIIPNTAGQ